MPAMATNAHLPIQVVEKLQGVNNFDNWKFCIKLVLEERGLWEVVNGDKATPLEFGDA